LPDIAVVCAVSRNIELEVNFETRGAYLAAPNKIGAGTIRRSHPALSRFAKLEAQPFR
jgi:hypothetical protein